MESTFVRGIDSAIPLSRLGQLTQWKEVTALELKLAILCEKAASQEKEIDSDNMSNCPICLLELYEGLMQSERLDFEIQQQMILIQLKDLEREEFRDDFMINVVKLGNCNGMHFFHKECLEKQYKASGSDHYLKCTVCSQIYGKIIGTMPSGRMTWSTLRMSLPGFESCQKAIVINYDIPNGKLPTGVEFIGTQKTAYLPDNKEGQVILSLFAEAFRRRLIFKVDTYAAGQQNQIFWGTINHKTSPIGGSQYGYPDSTYFSKVKDQLAANGLTVDLIGTEIKQAQSQAGDIYT
ncbi:hypothetical protein FGO68_gene6149 [Halteria grandinella]|uniref:RING-type E3 ubiquitin transferase n=1 Tax=Halteria grandinella TaxID=5974 RepID=A0A8J8NKR7_HALGN|nr:hypothetical protein FGO68_gene6149 [Halteria grandinella]